MHPLIFVPNESIGSKALEKVGLSAWLQGANFCTIDKGPQELSGIVATWPRSGWSAPDYDISKQRWLPADDLQGDPERYYIGFWKQAEHDFIPSELVLPKTQRGTIVKLGRHEWLIPQMSELDALLCRKGGKWIKHYTQEAASLKHDTLHLIHRITTADAEPVTLDEFWLLCVRILQVNYRITIEMISESGMFREQSCEAIFSAFTGLKVQGGAA